MAVRIVPVPPGDLNAGLRQWAPGLFRLFSTVAAMIKDRRYFYFRQREAFANIADAFAMPYHVEIETINRCNSTCSFCPVNRLVDPRAPMTMPDSLFRKIIDDLGRMEFAGILNLFSNNEPFLDKRIFGFAEYARAALPRAAIHLYSNGTPLDAAKVERILPHIDGLRINNYATTPDLHANVRKLVDRLNAGPPDAAAEVRVYLRLLDEFKSSRAGNAPNRRDVFGTYRSRCAYPFYQLVIRPDGKSSLCCNDALGQETIGDLAEQTVAQAWNDPRRREVQALMLKGRDKLDICRHCDNLYVAKPTRVAQRDFMDHSFDPL